MPNNSKTDTTAYYKEPGPKLDQESPFESMMERFRFAAELLELDEGMFQYLASPVKQVIVSIPIVMDTYSMNMHRTETAVVTGKPTFLGGSQGRKEATGRGVVTVILAALNKLAILPNKCTVAVQRFGNVGSISAKLMYEQGAKLLRSAISPADIYNKNGIDIPAAMQYSNTHGNSLEGYPEAEAISNDELLQLECDVLIPPVKEDQISKKNADKIQARIIAEGANGPVTANADSILEDNGIMVVPDILAIAGGVVSYFEWVQDRKGYFWTEERLNRRLNRMMRDAFDNLFGVAEQYDITLRQAAYVYAIDKVAKTLKIRGIYA